jgi:hypothetical protein
MSTSLLKYSNIAWHDRKYSTYTTGANSRAAKDCGSLHFETLMEHGTITCSEHIRMRQQFNSVLCRQTVYHYMSSRPDAIKLTCFLFLLSYQYWTPTRALSYALLHSSHDVYAFVPCTCFASTCQTTLTLYQADSSCVRACFEYYGCTKIKPLAGENIRKRQYSANILGILTDTGAEAEELYGDTN